MAKKAAKKAPEAEQAQHAPPIVGLIDIARIYPSEYNPRRRFDPASLQELAQSLKANGMLHPVVVRQHPEREGEYELLAGRRRYEAARLTGLPTVPCNIVNVDDDAAMDICVTENLQRKQLNPVEEARGIRMLIDSGRTFDDVADKLGKSIQWVRRRNAIADLIPAIAAEVERGTKPEGMEEVEEYEIPGWFQAPAAVLELTAKLPASVQASLAEKDRYRMTDTFEDYKAEVERALRQLEDAPWYDYADTTNAHRVRCEGCPKRTDAQIELFPELAKGDARCLDSDCWADQEKTWAWFLAREAAAMKPEIHPDDVRIVQDDRDDENAPKESHGPSEESRIRSQYAELVNDLVLSDNGDTLTEAEVLCLAATYGAASQNANRSWDVYTGHLDAQEGRKPTAKDALWQGVRRNLAGLCYFSPWNKDASHLAWIDRLVEVMHLDRDAIWADAEMTIKGDE